MTVLDIDGVQPVSTARDALSTADDANRLQLMEEMLRDRGYRRNQHGFLVAPGWQMPTAKVETGLIAGGVDSKDEQ